MVAVASVVTAYAEDVVAGRVPAGNLVRLACARHLRDLADGAERGLRFDEAAADRAIGFYGLLPHIKGEWAAPTVDPATGDQQPAPGIRLEPWQAFIIGSLFGWKGKDGLRRFRGAYCEIPRKNGKSTVACGIGLLLAFFDGEPGAEVYAAATKRDQAKIVWGDARRMVQRRPYFRSMITAYAGNLHHEASASKFEPLGADEDTLDGLNIHGAIVDELHAHKTRAVVDVLETATGSRRQPLIFYITTAGFDRNSVCWAHHDYTVNVLDGTLADDSWFGYIAAADPGDDWQDPKTWAKANPNYGISVKPDDLERKARRAAAVPSEQNAFRRLHLDIWTEQAVRWLPMERWDAIAAPVDAEALAGRPCYAGLDLSRSTDLTALTLLFPDAEGGYDALFWAWVPDDNLRDRIRRDRVPYDVWAEQGVITLTPGNVVDYDLVEGRVLQLAQEYRIEELAIDRYNGTGTATRLADQGIEVVGFGQGFLSMSSPAKELERLVLEGTIRHGGNPLARWSAANVTVVQDAAENIKPAKDKSNGRIDPIVALLMALGRALVHPNRAGAYEQRGLRSL